MCCWIDGVIPEENLLHLRRYVDCLLFVVTIQVVIVFTFQVTGFRSYVDLYVKDKVDEMGNAVNVVHEVVNERWEVCLTMSEKGFQQVSFVNSIATTKVQVTLWSLSDLWPLFKNQGFIMFVGILSSTF